ncbi:hypothetical protein OROGR_009415 [Orobanche gracilis]
MRFDDYKFMEIVDAIACVNQKVNVIGVVIESSLPQKSKGTDFFVSVRIIDESRPSPGFGITIFAETMDRLPHVESVGDILLISQVVVTSRGPDVFASFNKKLSSFALFKGRDCSCKEFVPYQISSNYKPREDDKKFITALRQWSIQHKIQGLNESSSLREIKEGGHVNLLCKVKEDEWMLFVWDGTDTPPASVETNLERKEK